MKVTVAQLDPVVGDIDGNLRRLVDTVALARGERADLVVFPELFLVGYPPRDLLEKSWFIAGAQQAIEEVQRISAGYPETGILFGAPVPSRREMGSRGLYNAAVLVYRGRILSRHYKALLPIYDVFDEARYFDPAPEVATVSFRGEMLGISICEDAWNDPAFLPKGTLYSFDPVADLATKGATLFINISASPFHVGKETIRHSLLRNHALRYGVPFLYVNQVGANDEIVFDGRSMFLDRKGEMVAVFPSFEEKVQTIDTGLAGTPGLYAPEEEIATVYRALVLGIRDYMRKCGFAGAVVGLSGGIDSAVTCCLAEEALGRDNVIGISMPSPYSSPGSIEDSRRLAGNLGIKFDVVPISTIFDSYLTTLRPHLEGREADVTEENVQARIRGNILMAYSNKFGFLVLSTGNKSEMAVGYCTLYGDMSGGLSVLGDVPKTMVYELARFINREREIIPRESITKPPSAELRPGQVDQDSLPPYEILDQILHYYVEEGLSQEEIVGRHFDPDTVNWVIRAVSRSEYKRKQAAPVLKVTTKAFGVGRRMPIAARYRP